MRDLELPDSHHLSAAQGWLGLSNPAEAARELDRIHPSLQGHVDVLEVRWDICAQQKLWEAALQVARQVIAVAPDRCSGWINQSYCLHEMKQTAQAMDCLLPLAMKFPKVSTIPYNLACYACQLGRIHEARKWLAKAAKIAGKDNLLPIALADPDLKPLWPEIEKNL